MLNAVYNRVLSEAQSKSKQKEYGISKENYPNYIRDTDDLDYFCIHAILNCAKAIINNELCDKEELKLCCDYFDSASNIEKVHEHTNEYLLFAATANFFMSNFGNSKVFISLINNSLPEESLSLAYFICKSTNPNQIPSWLNSSDNIRYKTLIEQYFVNGSTYSQLVDAEKESISKGFEECDVNSSLFGMLFLAAIMHSKKYLCINALEAFSDVPFDEWLSIFKKGKLPSMLWPSQMEIGNKGGYKDENLVIQAPTGSGKTKSIQLIIASQYLRKGNVRAIVLSPLRSLCDEISNEISNSLKNIPVLRISDILEENCLTSDENYVLVLTPEKFEYILFHDKTFADPINLIIIDEGHLLEDVTRGTGLELLLSDLKTMNSEKRMIFISAVLKNVNSVADWLFGDSCSIVQPSNISTTQKSISKLNNGVVHFYDPSNLNKPIYYVKNSISVCQLNKKGRETKNRVFPQDDSKDLSIYFMFLLSKNGGVAVFFKRKSSIHKYINRIIELKDRGYQLTEYQNNEIIKLINLIRTHYGKCFLEEAIKIKLGFHYSTLEEGVKKTIEQYLRKRYIDKVFCTSTLSEGINIPIKYLIIPDLNQYMYDIKTREMINLVGRAARNGEYSEGTVLVTAKCDDEVFVTLFDEQKMEPLQSAIKILVAEKLNLAYSIEILDFYRSILGYLNDSSNNNIELLDYMLESFKKYCAKNKLTDNNKINWISNEIRKYCEQAKGCIDYLKIYISNYVYYHSDDSFETFFGSVISNTFFYKESNDQEKEKISAICQSIYSTVVSKMKFARTLPRYPFANIEDTVRLVEWHESNKHLLSSDLDAYVENLLILFKENNKTPYIKKLSLDRIKTAFRMWINGKTMKDISEAIQTDVFDVETLCRVYISSYFSNFVGNAVDIIGDDENVGLRTMQKRIKYGLSGEIAIYMYENGISDRYISELIQRIKVYDEVCKALMNYPDWFVTRYKQIIEQEK